MQLLLLSLVIPFCLGDNVFQPKNPIPEPCDKFLLRDCFTEVTYCREGSQGPCREDQVFVENDSRYPADNEENGCHSSELSESECTNDFSISSNTGKILSTNPGICVWSGKDNPCPGYPISFVYLNETGKCFQVIDAKDFCFQSGKDFYYQNNKFGVCDCGGVHGIYWAETDQCYSINSQGPCNDGQWLVLDHQGNPTCVETSCPADGSYVLYENPLKSTVGCYQLGTKDVCENGQTLQRLEIFPEKIECADTFVVSFGIAIAKTHSCEPGSKLNLSGECKKVF